MKTHLFTLLAFTGAWTPVWGIIGLYGLVTKKPFVSSFNRNLVVWGVSMEFLYFLFLGLSGEGPKTTGSVVVAAFFIAFLTIIMVIIPLALPLQYSAYGVRSTSLRQGLLASLKKLNLSYEESPTGLRLPTIEADLQVTVPWSRWGAGYVRIKQQGFEKILSEIANGLKRVLSEWHYYRRKHGLLQDTGVSICFIGNGLRTDFLVEVRQPLRCHVSRN